MCGITNICPNLALSGRADSSSAAASDSNTRGEGLTEFGKVRPRDFNGILKGKITLPSSILEQ